MLPVHSSTDAQVVTNFIAIQKDVTYLRKTGTKPAVWSAVEVGLWCDAVGLPHIGTMLFTKVLLLFHRHITETDIRVQGVLGRELLQGDSEVALCKFGVSATDAPILLQHIRYNLLFCRAFYMLTCLISALQSGQDYALYQTIDENPLRNADARVKYQSLTGIFFLQSNMFDY